MLVRKKDPATVPRAAFEVLDSAQQAIGLINDLLDLSRLDEDRLKPVIRSVEPVSVARRALGRMTPAAEARHIRLELEPAAGLPGCETDASRLEQILVNLLGNAITHSPEASTVRLGSAPASHGRVLVEDQGPGHPGDRSRADLRHLRDQGRGREPGRRARPSALPPAGAPAGRRAEGGAARRGQGGRFVLELPAAPDS